MADTTFVDKSTLIVAAWLNDVNAMRYGAGSGLKGAALLQFIQVGTGAIVSDIQTKSRQRVHVSDFRAVGDPDDTAAWQRAIASGATQIFANRTTPWAISTTLLPNSNTDFNLGAAQFTCSLGATPLFKVSGAKTNIHFHGGYFVGTASAVFELEGNTDTPSAFGDYASRVVIDGSYAASTTLAAFLLMKKGVREIFITNVFANTVSGVVSTTKGVAIYYANNEFYSSTGAAGSVGVGLTSLGGTTFYNEGHHFVNCLVDQYETSFNLVDIFALTFYGGYVSAKAGGYAFKFGQPTTTTCRHFNIGGFTCSGPVQFAPTGGYAYHALFTGVTFSGLTGANIQAANNAANIAVKGCSFDTSTNGVVFEGVSNNASLVVTDNQADSTFVGGIQIKGTIGADCMIDGLQYAGSGDAVFLERPVLVKNVPVSTANVAALKRKFNSGDLAGNVTVGNPVATVTNVDFAKGETGWIVVDIACTGMNAATQRFDVALPGGLTTPAPSGTGWSALNLMTGTAGGRVTAMIPYYASAAVAAGTITLTNAAGNTAAVLSHSHFGIVRDW